MNTAIINGVKTTATCFAFDGCHKIYLIEDMQHVPEVIEYGYAVHPIDELQQKWDEECCSLRFINTWSDLDSVIEQGCEKTHHFHIYK